MLESFGDAHPHEWCAEELVEVVSVAAPWCRGHAAEHLRVERVDGAPECVGADVVGPDRRSPEYLQKFVENDIKVWAEIVKAAGITPE